MKFSRAIVAVLSLLLVGEAGLIWLEWTQLKALRALSLHEDEALNQQRFSEKRIAALRDAIKRAQTEADQKKAAATAALAAKAKSTGSPNGKSRRDAQMEIGKRWAQANLKALENKDFLAALATMDRAWNERKAGAFLRGLGLSPEQVSHMYDLMGQMMVAQMEANQSAYAAGLQNDSRVSLVVDNQKDVAAQIQAYLGDDNFAAYQQFNRELTVRSVATNLQTSLSYTASPLTDAQSQQLIAAMYSTVSDDEKNASAGAGALYPLSNDQPQMVSKAELEAAKSILSAPQMAALQAIYNGQQAMRAIQRAGGL